MAPTPPAEIARQHEAAKKLCTSQKNQNPAENNGSDSPITIIQSPEKDEISLQFKRCSIQTVNDPSSLQVWSSRGHVDVSGLQNLVKEGYSLDHKPSLMSPKLENASKISNQASSSKPKSQVVTYKASDVVSETNYWDPVNASVHNVAIVRPSHDAWGIGKIVLTFCDDFLQNVFELPWFDTFREALGPILSVLNISDNQIVRCLLADLPPGVTIPVHFDTGYWVHQTHRVHVPIIVERPQDIYFACGLSADDMQRVCCTPGHVFEINNQVWHTVSNCSPLHRVHLILDYTDEAVKRIKLDPGERLLQTRRSVDRVSSKPRPVPSFLILGAQKAGTTSLYHYITQHPLVVKSKRRETHCLDWRWNSEAKTTVERQAWVRNFYYYDELQKFASCCTGDSTPSYLLDSRRVIGRLREVFPHLPALVVTCREPLARCWSHYQMVTSKSGTKAQLETRGSEWRDKTIQQVVHAELWDMKDCGLIPYFDMATGACDRAKFNEFCDSEEEISAYDLYLSKHVPLHTGSHNLLVRSMYALQLRAWLTNYDTTKILLLPLEALDPDCLPKTMETVYRHLGLPSTAVVQDNEPKNVRHYDDKMPCEVQSYLRILFGLHNERLKRLVPKVNGSSYWKDVKWLQP